jgi:cytidyltransferase-like protein
MSTVFVSGCFDLLHTGHICFLESAARYGDLYVSVAKDETIRELKREPVYSEKERLYIVRALRHVKDAFISSGVGQMDVVGDVRALRPDYYVVNADGHCQEKEDLCKELGIKYVVLDRTPAKLMPQRSTTETLKKLTMPYRIDIAGAWLDQPWVSSLGAGSVITASIEPDYDFPDRTGMATSTRKRAINLWGNDIPFGDKEQLARILFCYDNYPGGTYISGSQDSIGIVFPGINKLNYEGKYWPESIDTIANDKIVAWLEQHFRLIPTPPKYDGYDVMKNININKDLVHALSTAVEGCWASMLEMDAKKLGKYVTDSFHAQVAMFPNMMNQTVQEEMEKHNNRIYGMNITGSGGFICAITPEPIENEIRIRIRNESGDTEKGLQ